MLKKDVVVGEVYVAKVGQRLTYVRLIRASKRDLTIYRNHPNYYSEFGDYYGRKKSAQRTSWSAINLATGRDITIKSAAKLRGFAPSDWEQRLAEKRKDMGYK